MLRQLLTFAAAMGLMVSATVEASPSLRLHVPRTVNVTDELLTLENVAVLHSADKDLLRLVGQIKMGRSPRPGESIVIDQHTILARLASSNVYSHQIKLTGAGQVVVQSIASAAGLATTTNIPHKINNQLTLNIPAANLIQAAQKYLKSNPLAGHEGGMQLSGKPSDLRLPAPGGKWTLDVTRAAKSPARQLKLRVRVISGDKELASRNITYRLTYPHRQIIATRKIPVGQQITAKNTEIRSELRNYPESKVFVAPYGMVATRRIEVGKAVPPSSLRSPKPQLAVKRNQTVVMKISMRGFSISTFGMAMQDGVAGAIIRVRNIDTKRIVSALVTADGTVQPIVQR